MGRWRVDRLRESENGGNCKEAVNKDYGDNQKT